MTQTGERIIEGLRDALAFARGEPNGCVVTTAEEIAARRRRLQRAKLRIAR